MLITDKELIDKLDTDFECINDGLFCFVNQAQQLIEMTRYELTHNDKFVEVFAVDIFENIDKDDYVDNASHMSKLEYSGFIIKERHCFDSFIDAHNFFSDKIKELNLMKDMTDTAVA